MGRTTRAPSPTDTDTVTLRHRFERLLSAGVAIFAQHTLKGVLQQVVDVAREVVGARYAALGVFDADGTSLAQFVTSGLDDATRARIGEAPHGRGLLGLVIREARPIRTTEIARHPQHFGFPPHHPPMTSFLGVPITSGKTLIGNLYLTDKDGGAEFTEEDEAIAVLLAAQAAVGVENARLFEESERLLGQVRAMQRQRDLFFAMMNHELRNALTGVFGWAERVLRAKSPESVAQAGREVYDGAERTITLLNNFLDLTRLDAGKLQPVWRELEIGAEVHRAINGFEPIAEQKQVKLVADLPEQCPPVVTDPVRLQQIIVNLLSNAVRHSPVSGEIQIAVRCPGSKVEIAVRDQGPGVPPDVRERIFEPFERFDPDSGHGTGLGLPVSRRLAQVLGGSLEVEPTQTGAAFVLSLPLTPARW